MKKLSLTVLCLVLAVTGLTAQTATNADGTKRYNGNVAILVSGNSFTFKDGNFTKVVDDETLAQLTSSLRLLAFQDFQNAGWGVVNRDNEASEQVKQLIKENKLEDYLDGYSVQAKNQGADYLFVVELTLYSENEYAVQMDIATRLINVETNVGYHAYYRSDALGLSNHKDIEESRDDVSKMIKAYHASVQHFLADTFPEQYFVAKADGKNWDLGVYGVNGAIRDTDKFYAFKFRKSTVQMYGSEIPLVVMDRIATCDTPTANGGYLRVKSDKSVSDFSDIVIIKNASQPTNVGVQAKKPATYFGLNFDPTTYDGFIQNRINNAVYSAITRHPGFQLIEHDHLSDLRDERELQKGEDFLDGHTVEQMKAIGADILIKIEGYERVESLINLQVSVISVSENRIIKTFEVTTSIDNIENEMYKMICERIANPCTVRQMDDKTLELTCMVILHEGCDCILQLNKEVINPMTGEVSYNKVELCKLQFAEYHGNQSVYTIKEVLSKDDMKDLEAKSAKSLLSVKIDASNIRSDFDTRSDVQKQAEKSEKADKRKGFWNKVKEAAAKTIKVDVNTTKVERR